MFGRIVVAVLAALSLYACNPAYAQQLQCGKRAGIVQQLGEKYQESRVAVGMVSEKIMLEVFASPKGTWTLLLTNEQGISCLHGTGEAWEWSTEASSRGRGHEVSLRPRTRHCLSHHRAGRRSCARLVFWSAQSGQRRELLQWFGLPPH